MPGKVYGHPVPDAPHHIPQHVPLVPSDVEAHARREENLDQLWQRTARQLAALSEAMGKVGDEMMKAVTAVTKGGVIKPADARQWAAFIQAGVLDVVKVRIQVDRLRPASAGDVAGQMKTVTQALARLNVNVAALTARMGVSATPGDADASVGVSDPRPPSYRMPMPPHEFMPIDEDHTFCVAEFPVPGNDGSTFRCAYAANASIHRRLYRMEKNGEPAPADAASARERAGVTRIAPDRVGMVFQTHVDGCGCDRDDEGHTVDLRCVSAYVVTAAEQ